MVGSATFCFALYPENRPASMSAMIHGPGPLPLPQAVDGAEVGGFHGAGAHGAAVRRGVAVVEAAAAVVVRAVDDVVDALRLVVDRDAGGIVVAEPHARHDVDAVGLVAADRDRRHVRDRLGVECALRRAREDGPGGAW